MKPTPPVRPVDHEAAPEHRPDVGTVSMPAESQGRPGGHLARLVERARPNEALLQRRQPSRFEPVQPWAEAAGLDDAVTAGPSTPPRAESPSIEPAITAVAAPRAPQPDVVHTGPHQPQATATPAAAVQQHELQTWRETLRVDRSVVATPYIAMPVAGTPKAPMQAVAQPAAVPVVHATAHGAPAAEAPLARPRRPATESAPSPSRRQAASNAPAPMPASAPRTEAPLLRAAQPPAIGPVGHPHATPRQGATLHRIQAPQAPAPHELPPVQVTIGRIEVRAAVSAPAAAETRRRPDPRLSLEQYLRERHGGHR